MSRRRILLPAFIVLFALFLYRSGHAIKSYIVFPPQFPTEVVSKPYSSCRTVHHPNMNMCEDMAVWEKGNGSLILSCDPGRKKWNTVMGPLIDPSPRGGLHVYSPSTGKTTTLELVDFPDGQDFHPLGLDVHGDHLYVINHARQRTFVEHFVLHSKTKAKYARTLDLPVHFKSANSIALTSEHSFYVSNDHTFTRRLPGLFGHVMPMVETLLGLPLAWISYVDAFAYKDPESFHEPIRSARVVARGLSFANGISVSQDGTALAVASSSTGSVSFYRADNATRALKYDRTVNVPIGADNVRFDREDNLVVGGHANFLRLIRIAKGAQGVKAPSWVMEIKKGSSKWESLYQSDGSAFGSSSTGVKHGDKLYIIGLYERGLMTCQ